MKSWFLQSGPERTSVEGLQREIARDTALKSRTQAMVTLKTLLVTAPQPLREQDVFVRQARQHGRVVEQDDDDEERRGGEQRTHAGAAVEDQRQAFRHPAFRQRQVAGNLEPVARRVGELPRVGAGDLHRDGLDLAAMVETSRFRMDLFYRASLCRWYRGRILVARVVIGDDPEVGLVGGQQGPCHARPRNGCHDPGG